MNTDYKYDNLLNDVFDAPLCDLFDSLARVPVKNVIVKDIVSNKNTATAPWVSFTHVLPDIDRIIFSNPTTVVFFTDGTKCVVKTSAHDKFDKEHGVLYAIFKRLFGKVNPETHEVETNGCGTYLKRLVENAFDQEAKKTKKVKATPAPAKKTTSKKTSSTTKRGGSRR